MTTKYDQQGFLTTATVPEGVSTTFDDKGFPVTVFPQNCQASDLPAQVANVLGTTTGLPTALSEQSSSPASRVDVSGCLAVGVVGIMAALALVFA